MLSTLYGNPVKLPPEEVIEYVTSMRAAGKSWPFIAKSLGSTQKTLASKFRRWRKRGLTDLNFPEGEPIRSKEGVTELLASLRIRGEWWKRGLCRKMADPDTWYPPAGRNGIPAKRVCQDCPVRAQCLEYALKNDEKHGVWGGLSERERRALRKSPEWRTNAA